MSSRLHISLFYKIFNGNFIRLDAVGCQPLRAIAYHRTVLLKKSIISQIFEGARDGSARAYIEPALTRSNLDVLVNTLVTKVVQTGTENDLPVFRGVQFAQNNSGMLELCYFTVGIVGNVRADTGS